MKRGRNRTKAAVKYKEEREHGCLSIDICVNEREKSLSPFELFPLNPPYNTKGCFYRKQFLLCPTFCTCDLYNRSLTEIKFYSYNWHFIYFNHPCKLAGNLYVTFMFLADTVCSNPKISILCL